jgi:hypothetical protein
VGLHKGIPPQRVNRTKSCWRLFRACHIRTGRPCSGQAVLGNEQFMFEGEVISLAVISNG